MVLRPSRRLAAPSPARLAGEPPTAARKLNYGASLSSTGERLSAIFLASSSGMLGRTTTWQLQVPFGAGTLALNALVSFGFRAVLSWKKIRVALFYL